MGQTLDKPVENKETHRGDNQFALFGCSSEQGYRVSMEDRHNYIGDIVEADLVSDEVRQWLERTNTNIGFFAVYDGHSGDLCADYLSKNLARIVLAELEKTHTKSADDEHTFTLLDDNDKIQQAYIKTDLQFQETCLRNNTASGHGAGSGHSNHGGNISGHAAQLPQIKNKSGYLETTPADDSGTTAVTLWIKHNKTTRQTELICANTGDSRCVLHLGRSKSAEIASPTEPMSYDHKPTNAKERERIKNAGGYVEFGRVNGTLAVSRAFGDLGYKTNGQIEAKDQAVTALPDLKRVHFTVESSSIDNDENKYDYVILACDGIWDVMTNDVASNFVQERLQRQKGGDYWKHRLQEQQAQVSPQQFQIVQQQFALQQQKNTGSKYDVGAICEDFLDTCVRKLDSKDNVSCAIVLFK